MMKRIVGLMVSLVLVCCISLSFADAKITATDEKLILYPGETHGYFFARVENTGDVGAYFGNAKLVIFSDDDDLLVADDFVGTSPSSLWLEPGEYAYVIEMLWDDVLKTAKVGDVKFSPKMKEYGIKSDRVTAEAKLAMSGQIYDNFIEVTFSNKSSEPMKNFQVVCALWTADDQLVYVASDTYNSLSIHPDSTVTVMMRIDSKMVQYYQDQGIKPEKTDATVYVLRED